MAGGWRLANSLVKLRDTVNAAYPNRSRASDGTIGDTAHASGPSDHNPNAQGVVCAMDLTHDPANGFNAHAMADHLISHRNPNMKYLISNSRIAGAWTGWKWTPYYGSNPHDKHVHISVGTGSDGQSLGPYDGQEEWDINKGGSTVQNATTQDVHNLVNEVWGVPPNANNLRDFTGVPWSVFFYAVVAAGTPWSDRKDILLNRYPALQKVATDLRVRNTQLETQAANAAVELSTLRTTYEKQVADLKAQLAVQSDDTKNLNALGLALQWAIKRLGISK